MLLTKPKANTTPTEPQIRPVRSIDLHLPTAHRVLDFGCGSGWVLARSSAEGNPLRYGVDYSLDGITGKSDFPIACSEPSHPMMFSVGDGLALPFRDQTFDVVIGHVSMPYMNTRLAFQEIHRVLTPGGSIFLTFHSFLFMRNWLSTSLRAGRLNGIVYAMYMGLNGLLNHFGRPQSQVWWNRGLFETVNTEKGAAYSARAEGFQFVSTEWQPDRIYFALTARKAGGADGVLPAPSWAIRENLKPTINETTPVLSEPASSLLSLVQGVGRKEQELLRPVDQPISVHNESSFSQDRDSPTHHVSH